MAKGGKTQTVKQELDPATKAYQEEVYRRSIGASNQSYTPYQGQTVAGVSPLSEGAAGTFQDVSKLAGLGASALGGDAGAISRFMNPYQTNVIDQLNQTFDRQRSQAQMATGDAATAARAFGGSRHALVEGTRLGEIDRAQGDAIANLLYGGFNDAMGRAAGAANLGLGAAGQAFGAGDYMRNVQQQYLTDNQNRFNEARDWELRNLGVLQGGLSGTPYGTQQSTPLNRNPVAGALGGAATGAQFGVPGAIAGGVIGLLGF